MQILMIRIDERIFQLWFNYFQCCWVIGMRNDFYCKTWRQILNNTQSVWLANNWITFLRLQLIFDTAHLNSVDRIPRRNCFWLDGSYQRTDECLLQNNKLLFGYCTTFELNGVLCDKDSITSNNCFNAIKLSQ